MAGTYRIGDSLMLHMALGTVFTETYDTYYWAILCQDCSAFSFDSLFTTG